MGDMKIKVVLEKATAATPSDMDMDVALSDGEAFQTENMWIYNDKPVLLPANSTFSVELLWGRAKMFSVGTRVELLSGASLYREGQYINLLRARGTIVEVDTKARTYQVLIDTLPSAPDLQITFTCEANEFRVLDDVEVLAEEA